MDTIAIDLDMGVQSRLISAQTFLNVSTSTNYHDIDNTGLQVSII